MSMLIHNGAVHSFFLMNKKKKKAQVIDLQNLQNFVQIIFQSIIKREINYILLTLVCLF